MRVIGVLLNALGAFWIVMGTWFVLDTWKPGIGSSTASTAIGFVLFFALPGLLFLLLGSWLLRRGKRLRALREQAGVGRGGHGSRTSRGVYDEPPADGGRPSYEAQMAGLEAQTSRYSAEEPETAEDQPSADGGSTIYRTKSVRSKAGASGLVVAVCRSCGSRKTVRAGTETQCEYCGAPIEETQNAYS